MQKTKFKRLPLNYKVIPQNNAKFKDFQGYGLKYKRLEGKIIPQTYTATEDTDISECNAQVYSYITWNCIKYFRA